MLVTILKVGSIPNFRTNITRTVWQTVGRISNEILGFKELRVGYRHIIGTIIYCVTDYDQNDNDG